MKEFFTYFFGMGSKQEFALFTLPHFAPILVMFALIAAIYFFRDNIRRFRKEENLRLALALTLIICDMS